MKTEIVKCWSGNKNNTMLFAIPKKMGKKYGLDKPCYLIMEEKADGILIRKLET